MRKLTPYGEAVRRVVLANITAEISAVSWHPLQT